MDFEANQRVKFDGISTVELYQQPLGLGLNRMVMFLRSILEEFVFLKNQYECIIINI